MPTTITGTSGPDTINGTSSDDLIYALEGDDLIYPGLGIDTVYGGDGDDRIVVITAGVGTSASSGTIVIRGDGGFDTLDLSQLHDSLPDGDRVLWYAADSGVVYAGHVESFGIERFIGSPIGDFFDVSYFAIYDIDFDGGGGNDYINTKQGNDTLHGGSGDDYINPGGGNNTVFGDDGADYFSISSGTGTIDGGNGNDTIEVFGFSDLETGTATSGSGNTYSITAIENVRISASLSPITVKGNDNTNILSAYIQSTGSIFAEGRGGDDTLIGGGGNDHLDGGTGDDTLIEGAYSGPRTDDFFDGGDGIDTADLHNAPAGLTIDLRLGLPQDTGGDGIDTFVNIENIVGSSFNDILIGSASGNRLYGGAGNDVLEGIGGGNLLDGGAGNDTASYAHATSGVSAYLSMGGGGGDGYVSIENLSGSAFADVLYGDDNANLLSGGDGDDYIFAGYGNDTLDGGAGADTLIGGDGDDFYITDGLDTINETNSSGIDSVFSSANLTLGAGLENLTLTGTAAINGTGSVDANQITGNDAANMLSGGGGWDNLRAAGGNDRLSGGDGNDTLTGGIGTDLFIDTAAGLSGDTISDLERAEKIVVTDASLSGFTFSLTGNTLHFNGGFLTLTTIPAGHLVARAAATGGVELSFTGTVQNDFNGDGRSDILWRNSGGAFSDWLGQTNGGFVGNDGNAFANIPVAWKVAGTGDFNGDGRADVLWRNDNGQLSDWLGQANGGFAQNDANAFNQVPTAWKIVGTGDFNGDGRSDILWRNDNGQLSDWLGQANGGFVGNDANAFTSVPISWKVVGTGDFNGDGRSDILWRNDNGQLSDWLGQANGGFVGNDANAFTSVPTIWKVVGTGDFNGDGRSDILWRNDNGQLSNWLGQASGGFVGNDANAFTSVPTSWHVADIGDYNGDGRDDILWRNGNGQLSDWLGQANGGFAGNDANALTSAPTSWLVQSPDSLYL